MSGHSPALRAEPPSTLFKVCSADPLFSRRYDMRTWEPLGRGGSADVLRLYCHLLRRDVAVKIFRLQGEDDPRRRIPDEVMNPGRASEYHVQVFGAHENTAGDLVWIEMEYVGPSLKQEMLARAQADRWFTIEEALGLSLAAARAVGDAHSAGVIHRDIKPANFLLTGSGADVPLKLGDFGISKMREVGITESGEFPGTPEFAAPEIARGEACRASDIYSLAVTLFRLITGAPPIVYPQGSSILAIIDAHRNQRPRSAAALRGDVPRGVSTLLDRMLSKEPVHRPCAEDVVTVFEEEIRRRRESAAPADLPQPIRKSRRRSLLIAAGAVPLAVALAVGVRPASPPERRVTSLIPVASSAIGTPPVRDTPMPARRAERNMPPLSLEIDGPGLWLEPRGSEQLEDVRVSVLTVEGRRHVLSAGVIRPGSGTWAAFESFHPTLAPNTAPADADVTIAGRTRHVPITR